MHNRKSTSDLFLVLPGDYATILCIFHQGVFEKKTISKTNGILFEAFCVALKAKLRIFVKNRGMDLFTFTYK